jgi:hypothetical protein
VTSGSRLLKGLDVLTNLAIVAAAVAVVSIAWARYRSPPASPPPGAIRPGVSLPVGGSVPIAGVDWKKGERTVVLVLSTSCHFCAQSTPFYQRIAGKRKDGVRLVAVFREDVAAGRSYLTEHEIEVDHVLQVPPDRIGVRGVPALLVVDRAGRLSRAWSGKVSESTEAEILGLLPSTGA